MFSTTRLAFPYNGTLNESPTAPFDVFEVGKDLEGFGLYRPSADAAGYSVDASGSTKACDHVDPTAVMVHYNQFGQCHTRSVQKFVDSNYP